MERVTTKEDGSVKWRVYWQKRKAAYSGECNSKRERMSKVESVTAKEEGHRKVKIVMIKEGGDLKWKL